jgi:TonB-dependent starch-binding outer membrane protein SusC
LITAPILATAGANPPSINGGRVNNTGFEWEFKFQDNAGDFDYSVSVNGAYNKNMVTDIPTEDGIIHGATNSLYANSPEFYQAKTGHPLGYFWGFETDGLFQTKADVAAHKNSAGKLIQPSAQPGDVKFIDKNDDGQLNDADKVQLGNPNPPFTFGLNLSANYKAFDFSLSSFGVAGNDIVQSYREPGRYQNYTTAVLDRWTGEGTSNTIPRVTNTNVNYSKFSSLFIQDGSYLRISNVTLGYDFAKILKYKNLSQVRLYAAVNNLYTFTKYTGMDADVGFGFDNNSQDKFSSGIDLGFYPNPRTMLLGLSVKF